MLKWAMVGRDDGQPLVEVFLLAMIARMTMLELKQQVSRLSARERRELNACMIRLRHESPQWKRDAAKRMAAMDAGKKVSAEELDQSIRCA